ncbi:hypothetical protein [Streptococcus sp. SK643]|uniref:hypothetical protein n=1 Tax=Streptococcus sp. SK643 TaxID=1095727 RepID=UPI00025B12E1|nr:hypothetical protein [Streptococcus sp. SK643]EIF38233.1 hypothetical protein HMPREF1117_1833 [Streptococcus sp. SK643]
MKEEIYKLYEVCKRFNSRLGYSLEENKKLKDFKELIDDNLSDDFQELMSGISAFKEEIIDQSIADEQYSQFYYELLSSMANFSSYFADLHEIIFDLNKRRSFKMGEITKEELVSSDEIFLDDEDDESGN